MPDGPSDAISSGYTVFGDDYAAMSLKADDGSPLFQVPIPFGADYGGVNKELFKVKPSSEFDTWVTIGAAAGNAQSAIRSAPRPRPPTWCCACRNS